MSDEITLAPRIEDVEAQLRERLLAGDAVLADARPVLRHLLTCRDAAMFSDEVLARVRGAVLHLARQLLYARATAGAASDPSEMPDSWEADLAARLMDDTRLLAHLHGLTLEAMLTELLHQRSNFDTVLSPLLQELAASPEDGVPALAMRMVAAQARFMQAHRRMELPLGELPGDLFHCAVLAMRSQAGDDPSGALAEAALRRQFDEAQSRLGLMTRLVMGLGRKAPRALAVDHAGLALFTTALAMATAQDRGLIVQTFGEGQMARFALSLRAAGLGQDKVQQHFLYFHPDATPPEGLDWITPDHASTLLASSSLAKTDSA
ncbi:hypothetical protein [Alteraurantiacibacter palmitatis]|uniref:DUF2336 domain-containing protein n=1 Tax=Alteraurantiacibacter palmitatis TaxID=2054628 RepID=A0ABV7E4P3_9SPHN